MDRSTYASAPAHGAAAATTAAAAVGSRGRRANPSSQLLHMKNITKHILVLVHIFRKLEYVLSRQSCDLADILLGFQVLT